MKFLVDANVLSEVTKPEPDPNVLAWLRSHQSELVINPIILGEMEYGILLLEPGPRRARLEKWFAGASGNIEIIDFDSAAASAWAYLLAGLKRKGKAMPVKDSLIAASAISNRLIIATRNVSDFQHAGVDLVNPFAP